MKKLFALLTAALLLFTGCARIERAVYGAMDSAVSEAVSDAFSEYEAQPGETESEGTTPEETELEEATPDSGSEASAPAAIAEGGAYTAKDDVALYLHTYGKLPANFITKEEARALGWPGGSLEAYAPGCCIGGDRFGNYEGLLPKADGRSWYECDIDTLGAEKRGAKRIVFSSDGLIYYTDDHYESFTELYGE